MNKEEVADALDEIGTLLELKGENAFRTNAYHNGARAILQMQGDIADVIAQGKLTEVPGIGETLRDKITTVVTTGSLQYLEKLRSDITAGQVAMLRIPGVGLKMIIELIDTQ